MCDYIFKDGTKCGRDNFEDSRYCILHMDFPDKKNEEESMEELQKVKEECLV